jgi:quinoprotein glucose dehydrogenase
MYPRSLRYPRCGRLAAATVILLAVVNCLPSTRAAEPEAGASSARGKLKDEIRQTAPEIAPASDEGQKALARMKLPPGLKATLWAAEPMLANPVAFNFDEHGRVFVSETFRYRTSVLDIRDYMWLLEDDLADRTQDDFMASIRRNFGEVGVKELSKESEQIVLLEDTKGAGVADKSTVYADNFRTPINGIASGVLARRGEVWFTNIPALWHFTGHDHAETRTELLSGFGLRFNFTGHDLHGLIFGPDGRIYFSIGDRAAHVTTQEGTVVKAEDSGSVFRCYPDGSHFELFATGLRNPESLLFNEYGDLFTGDNDSDQGDEERLVHVVENGDSGWRIGYQFSPLGNAGPWNSERLWLPRHPSQPAYILPPICNIEDGPSGIAYYPGTGLAPEYAGHIFITHFKGSIPRSGIYAYKVKPAGASYAIEDAAPFLTNALPTDVRFGPDGRLYYSDWAEGWPKSRKGRIYAIFDPNRVNDPLVKETQQLIAADDTRKSDTELVALLAHPDWRVRLEAQYTLAERGADGVTAFSSVVNKADASPLARRHAVWGLGQLAEKNPSAVEALRPLLHDADSEIRAQSAKLLGDWNDQSSAEALVAALADPAPRVKFFAAQSLGKLKHSAAVPALLAAVRANNDADAYLRHALVLGLVGCAAPEQLGALTTDEARAVRLTAVLALRRQASPEVAKFLADADPLIVREAATAINDVPITAAFLALAAFLVHPAGDEATLLRALNVQFRLGGAENATALADYAARAVAPDALRQEALALLALWPAPPARDRIVGVYRPLAEKTRPANVAVDAVTPHLHELFATTAPGPVQAAALELVVKLKITAAMPMLRAAVAATAEPEAVRTAALKALDGFGDPQLAASAQAALASDSTTLRLTALPISTRLHPETAVAILGNLLEHGSEPEQRAAYAALGKLKQPGVDELLVAQLRKLDTGQIPAGTELELVEAAGLRSDPAVKQLLETRAAALAKDPDPLATYRIALQGGDPAKGRQLFYQHPVLACVRCHRANDEFGGEAGSHLAGIGAARSREYILESIVYPSAKIAPGFDTTIITRKSGAVIAGSMAGEDASSVTLRDSDGVATVVPKADIASRETAPSSMPAVFGSILSKAELRDLVAFVASLTTKPAAESYTGPRALRPPPTD